MEPSNDDIFRQAITSFHARRLKDAEKYLKEFLRYQPENVVALNILSIVLTSLQKYDEAERYACLALDANSTSDATFHNYGGILRALKRPNEALERFSQALAINPAALE
jgi:protein O-GlcNAc transferase